MKKFLAISFIGVALILAGSSNLGCSSGEGLSGTYVDTKRNQDSITFSGDQMTQVAYGMELKSTYEVKDGHIHWTNFSGDNQRTPYKLEGNTLTFDGDTYIKK